MSWLWRHKVWGVLIAIMVGLSVAGARLATHSPTLAAPGQGDERLVHLLSQEFDTPNRHRLVAALVGPTGTQTATFGADPFTTFPVASLTKTFTAALFAESIRRGEVGPRTRVGSLLPLGIAAVASTTLEELATYRSGLGEWGDDQRDTGIRRWWVESVRGSSIHNASLDEVLERAQHDQLSTRGQFGYSNIGFALLGHALAQAAGTDFPTLMRARLLEPLGMLSTALTPASGGPGPHGFSRAGQLAAPWPIGAYGPSGGAMSTLRDMTVYLRALLGNKLLRTAMAPQTVRGAPTGTGYGWMIDTTRTGHPVAFKSGNIGGFASALIVDVEGGRAVVVLSDTANEVIAAAWHLLEPAR
ncbi:serine hydrolase domain-containing protein [Gordonia crocea]|uniref:Serine hydrolase n=1 Tax=Gordonia crocea TaxID=589162 RepID=A0A7I9V0A3_9ACTN|nr:serine hydrolase domain-containing protein [Gordonia crocea]GED98573.1 serine hydrolase [Gordonia crocea]